MRSISHFSPQIVEAILAGEGQPPWETLDALLDSVISWKDQSMADYARVT
jgi:hypothetical protein